MHFVLCEKSVRYVTFGPEKLKTTKKKSTSAIIRYLFGYNMIFQKYFSLPVNYHIYYNMTLTVFPICAYRKRHSVKICDNSSS